MLFSNKSLQLVKYTDRDVGLCVAVVLLGEVVILGVMTGLQPAQFTFHHDADVEYLSCTFHEPTGITLLVYNVSTRCYYFFCSMSQLTQSTGYNHSLRYHYLCSCQSTAINTLQRGKIHRVSCKLHHSTDMSSLLTSCCRFTTLHSLQSLWP